MNMRYFLILSACSGIFSVTIINKYSRVGYLDGRKCLAGDIVFNSTNIVSVTECLKFCVTRTTCNGVSYRQATQECIGCNEMMHVNNVSDAFDKSLFYRHDECPDESGRIQLNDFRLQIYQTRKNQTGAEMDCRREPNRHLVMLDEEWKINALDNILTSCAGYNLTSFWTDGTREDSLLEWKFTDGRNIPMSQTTIWHAANPNAEISGRICLQLRYNHSIGYRLDDRRCVILGRYICEY